MFLLSCGCRRWSAGAFNVNQQPGSVNVRVGAVGIFLSAVGQNNFHQLVLDPGPVILRADLTEFPESDSAADDLSCLVAVDCLIKRSLSGRLCLSYLFPVSVEFIRLPTLLRFSLKCSLL